MIGGSGKIDVSDSASGIPPCSPEVEQDEIHMIMKAKKMNVHNNFRFIAVANFVVCEKAFFSSLQFRKSPLPDAAIPSTIPV
jgi:hypothetical protein